MRRIHPDVRTSAPDEPRPAGEDRIAIRLRNPSRGIAFNERAEITTARDATTTTAANRVRVTGYNTPPVVVPIE
jgi:hypothetical protein